MGAQLVPLAVMLDSNNALFIGHIIQIVGCILGYFFLSSIMFSNYWLFTVGMFATGFSYGLCAVQAYCAEIADGDEDFELNLMSQLGQLNIFSVAVLAFVMPGIYSSLGFATYCAALRVFVLCTLTVLCIVAQILSG